MMKTVTDTPLSWLIQRFHFSRPESQYLILWGHVLPVGLGTETLRWMEERMRIWVLPFQVHGFTKGHHPVEVCGWPARAEKHVQKRINLWKMWFYTKTKLEWDYEIFLGVVGGTDTTSRGVLSASVMEYYSVENTNVITLNNYLKQNKKRIILYVFLLLKKLQYLYLYI